MPRVSWQNPSTFNAPNTQIVYDLGLSFQHDGGDPVVEFTGCAKCYSNRALKAFNFNKGRLWEDATGGSKAERGRFEMMTLLPSALPYFTHMSIAPAT